MISQMPDLTRTIAYQTGPRALEMAGVTHDDIDLAMLYDSFTYTALVTIESWASAALERARISWPTSAPPPAAAGL